MRLWNKTWRKPHQFHTDLSNKWWSCSTRGWHWGFWRPAKRAYLLADGYEHWDERPTLTATGLRKHRSIEAENDLLQPVLAKLPHVAQGRHLKIPRCFWWLLIGIGSALVTSRIHQQKQEQLMLISATFYCQVTISEPWVFSALEYSNLSLAYNSNVQEQKAKLRQNDFAASCRSWFRMISGLSLTVRPNGDIFLIC